MFSFKSSHPIPPSKCCVINIFNMYIIIFDFDINKKEIKKHAKLKTNTIYVERAKISISNGILQNLPSFC